MAEILSFKLGESTRATFVRAEIGNTPIPTNIFSHTKQNKFLTFLCITFGIHCLVIFIEYPEMVGF
jgi:hypothetical protein